MENIQGKIYRVYTEDDVEGRTTRTLGYCSGKQLDIIAYFEDKKYYSIHLDEVEVKYISAQMVDDKIRLLKKQSDLEAELESIKRKLK